MEGACPVVVLGHVILTQNQLSVADLGCVDIGEPLYGQGLGSNPAVPEDLSEVLSQHSENNLQILSCRH